VFEDAIWAIFRRRTKVAVTHKARVSSNLPEDSKVPVAGRFVWIGLCIACSSLKRLTISHWEILAHLFLASNILTADATFLSSIYISIITPRIYD